MKKYTSSLSVTPLLLLLLSCSNQTPPPHPKNPRYEIIKPTIKYEPNIKNLDKMVKKLQGSPYVWAEEGPDNFDCSGFTYYMYGSMGIKIPRVAREQAKVGKKVSRKNLHYGDLIFFATNKKNHRKITHVGMYLGDGWFTHASTVTHKVIYSNLNTSNYYKKKLRICRRYLPNKFTQKSHSNTQWSDSFLKEDIKPFKLSSTVTAKSNAKKGNFYIQIGSFKSYPSTKFLHQIKTLGLAYRVIKFHTSSNTISKLFIGKYHNEQEAKRVLPLIQKKIEKDAFIVEIR